MLGSGFVVGKDKDDFSLVEIHPSLTKLVNIIYSL